MEVEDDRTLPENCGPEKSPSIPDDRIPITEDNYGFEKTTIDKGIPIAGMKFKSEEELLNYFHNYAFEVGFGVRKASSRKVRQTKYYSLGCAKGGKYKSNLEASKMNKSSKTECPAKITVIVNDGGTCSITRVSLDHNHVLSPKKARFHRSHKKLDPYSKRRLELNDHAGISLSKNYQSLVVGANGYENVPFGEKECRNYIAKVRRLRLGEGDAEALRNYFVRMQRRNSNFYYVIDMDDKGRLRNVFWADARSRAAYKSFGDVVSFDSTYLTNKYSMPFSPFVGVNHHGQSILFGCALLSMEDIKTYVWLFKSWLECMHGVPPKSIITDQDRSIQVAVGKVFPESHYRLCLWHIMKKIPEKLGKLTKYKEIKKTLKGIVYESLDRNEFDDGWSTMIKDYNLEKNEWLSSLYEIRERWVPIYVKCMFWAGMSTTQRSESMNAFFDGYVNSKTSLRQFVEQYENALKSKMEKENIADFDSIHSSYQLTSCRYFEKQFQEAYTNEMFRLFQNELRGMLNCNHKFLEQVGSLSVFNVIDFIEGKYSEAPKKRVVYTVYYNEVECDIRCSCYLFEFRGIICRHMIKVLIEKDVNEIPSRYILTRWRKDVKHSHHYVVNCYDDLKNSDQAMQFDNLCANFYEAANIANSRAKFEFLMKLIAEGTEKLKDDTRWLDDTDQVVAQTSDQMVDDNSNSRDQRLLSPLQVRRKGRPPTKRKVSFIEQVPKKSKASKGKESSGQDLKDSKKSTACKTKKKKLLKSSQTDY